MGIRAKFYFLGLFFSVILFTSMTVDVAFWRKKNVPIVAYSPAEATFPTSEIALPLVEFPTYPEKGTLDPLTSPRKIISTHFSSREINHVSVGDSERFKDSNVEIVDLSAIQEGDFVFPLPGAKVISPYGGRRRHHSGYDIKTCPRDTILAAFDGVVRLSKPYAAYGNLIVIRHYNGLETVYSHNSKNFVKPGDKVKAGDPIALTGRTGRATTAHLHFEVRFDGVHFNPNYVIDFPERKLKKVCLVCSRKAGRVYVKPVKSLPLYLLDQKKK